MSCGRIAFMFAFGFVLFPLAALAGGFCGADTILVRAAADTVYVNHANATMNCCLELRVEMEVGANVIDFYEVDAGGRCDCICCFDLDYRADGFPMGVYMVRVWDATGSTLYGQAEVAVPGAGAEPRVVAALQGECQHPQASGTTTWGKIRALYR